MRPGILQLLHLLVFAEIRDGLLILSDECWLNLNFVVNSATEKLVKTRHGYVRDKSVTTP